MVHRTIPREHIAPRNHSETVLHVYTQGSLDERLDDQVKRNYGILKSGHCGLNKHMSNLQLVRVGTADSATVRMRRQRIYYATVIL